jgi:glyoxylase-like metal-dependent hydrolase (beta-lactamase superfamily II)
VGQARRWEASVKYLLNTHAHWDHYWDNAAVLRLSGAKFGIHPDSAPLLKLPQTRWWGLDADIEPSVPDFYLSEDQPVRVGELTLQVLHCPGHCPGSVVFYEPERRVAFVGDVLFAGAIGRTDLPGGDEELLREAIRRSILTLDDAVRLYPGHGPPTTVGAERRTNPFLRG